MTDPQMDPQMDQTAEIRALTWQRIEREALELVRAELRAEEAVTANRSSRLAPVSSVAQYCGPYNSRNSLAGWVGSPQAVGRT